MKVNVESFTNCSKEIHPPIFHFLKTFWKLYYLLLQWILVDTKLTTVEGLKENACLFFKFRFFFFLISLWKISRYMKRITLPHKKDVLCGSHLTLLSVSPMKNRWMNYNCWRQNEMWCGDVEEGNIMSYLNEVLPQLAFIKGSRPWPTRPTTLNAPDLRSEATKKLKPAEPHLYLDERIYKMYDDRKYYKISNLILHHDFKKYQYCHLPKISWHIYLKPGWVSQISLQL